MQRIYLNYPADQIKRNLTEGDDSVLFNISLHDGDTITAGIKLKKSGDEITSRLCQYEWFWGTCLGQFSETPFNTSDTYTPTEQDYEQFIQIKATDTYGNVFHREFFLSKLPVMYINTEGGKPIDSKVVDTNANAIIQGNRQYDNQYNGKVKIHGRGHQSWEYPHQKPYKLKLDKKADLFGFGLNKHWVLLSTFRDSTMIRNKIAQDMSGDAGLLQMHMTPIVVIINGYCEGVYELSEHVRVATNRINIFNWEDESENRGYTQEDLSWIDTDPSIDVLGGQLFELDTTYDEVSKFLSHNLMRVHVNKPEYAYTSQRLFEAMKKTIDVMEGLYNSVDGSCIPDFIDMDTFVPYLTINMCLDNIDFQTRSRYCYKDFGQKIKFQPVWDFDIALGAIHTVTDPIGWKMFLPETPNEIGKYFLKYDWFKVLIRNCYINTVRQIIVNKRLELDTISEELSDVGKMNDMARRTSTYTPPSGDLLHLRTSEEDFAYLKWFLDKRLEWLDQVFATDKTFSDSLQPFMTFDTIRNYSVDYYGDVYDFNETIGTYKYTNSKSIYKAICPNATSIGSYAFYSCTSLTTASFPIVTSIGSSAFQYCSSLTTASFPNATSIGSYAFYSCTSLTTASFPNVTSIGSYAFYGCSSLTTASFPNATSIGLVAFRNCRSLTIASFPNATSIGNSAFYSCYSLTTVSFPNATSIGSYAFRYCSSLTSIYLLGSSVPALTYSNAFSYIDSNYKIYVPRTVASDYLVAAQWSTISSHIMVSERPIDIRFNLDDGNVVTISQDIGVVLQPKTGLSIWNPRYAGILDSSIASRVVSVDLDNTITHIGPFAFCGSSSYGFSKLTTVNDVNGAITSVGSSAFQYCSSLTTASFPNATSIGSYAFYSCTSLTTASFPNARSIGNCCFAECGRLKSIYVENDVLHSIDNGYGEERQIVTNTSDDMVYCAVGGISKVSNSNATSIGSYAFTMCTLLNNVSFPNVSSIGSTAFYSCRSLTNVSFPNVSSIGSWAFYSCRSLTNVSFPNTTTIGEYAFYYCYTLPSTSFPNVTSIGSSAFRNCSSLTSIYFLGSSVPTLANSNAFSNIATDYKIWVPESLYSNYLTASQWSMVSSHIASYLG